MSNTSSHKYGPQAEYSRKTAFQIICRLKEEETQVNYCRPFLVATWPGYLYLPISSSTATSA